DRKGEWLRNLVGHELVLRSLAFSHDGKHLVSLGRTYVRGEVLIWEVATGKLIAQHLVFNAPQQVAFSPDGTRLAMTDADAVQAWDVPPDRLIDLSSEPRLRLFCRAKEGNSMSFSDDGRRLAVTGVDQALRIWDLTMGEEVLTMRPHRQELVSHVAFSP